MNGRTRKKLREMKDREATALAFRRAGAWAASMPGTPYGVTEPVRTQEQLERELRRAGNR